VRGVRHQFPSEIRAIGRNDDQGLNSQILDGRGVFIINISDSFNAPHQAADNKYYARVGGKSRPVGHRLVADIFNRRQHPVMQLKFSIVSKLYTPTDYTKLYGIGTHELGWESKQKSSKRLRFDLSVVAKNIGSVLAQYMSCHVYVPVIIVSQTEIGYAEARGDIERVDGAEYIVWGRRNTRRDLIKGGDSLLGGSEYGSSWFDPILPKLSYSWTWNITNKFKDLSMSDEKIIWEIYADSAPVQSGEIRIADIVVEEVEEG